MRLRTKAAIAGVVLVAGAAGYGGPHATASHGTGHGTSHATASHLTQGGASGKGGGTTLAVKDASMPGNELLANQMAARLHGWGATQQHCLDLLWTEESAGTWSASIANPTSGALGIPQALTHGGPNRGGTLGNEYGDYGLTDAEARKANSGDAGWQIKWGLNYIEATYVNPCGAWWHEKHTNPNWY